MLGKIVKKEYKKIQLYGASVGALTGLILLLSAGQFYFDMQVVMSENKDLIAPEYLVVNKKVSFLETFNLKEATFSDREIREIREQEWAECVEGFISNQFALSAYAESERFPDFFTDLFFEAIPDGYLDVGDKNWQWSPGQNLVPIILPREYLNLYNFGFASSQGLPQISPETVSLVNFRIMIRGMGQSAEFDARIVGFSSRINSILVPWDFLSWANENYGIQRERKISRLAIVTKDPTHPEIISFLSGKGYETSKEKLKSSRLNIILRFIISVLGGLGAVIVFLSFLVFILSFQLMISRSQEKIQKLKLLGYTYREISRPYILHFAGILIILSILTLLILWALHSVFVNSMNTWNMPASGGIQLAVFISAASIMVLMFIVNSLAIIKQTRKT